MIRSVEISGGSETPYEIQMVQTDPNALTIQNIDGLGAGAVDLFFTPRASTDGNVFNGARWGGRNLVFELGFGHRLDPAEGRDVVYDIFPIKERVDIEFRTDSKNVTIGGYVESASPDIFTNDPNVEVSLICDPYFKGLASDRVVHRLYGLDDIFEFPFSNESLVEKKLILGEHQTTQFVELQYMGNTTTGITIRLQALGPVQRPRFVNERTGEVMTINFDAVAVQTGVAFGGTDVLEINTIRGERSITLIRKNVRHNVINAFEFGQNSRWIQIKKGSNPISINASSGVGYLRTEISYINVYSGL